MRLGRRALVGLGIGAVATAALGRRVLARIRGAEDVRPVRVDATPIRSLLPGEPDRIGFGDLTFRAGLVLASADDGFGGFSALWRSPDGRDLVALTDNAQWLTARVATDAAGRPTGLGDAVMAPILDESGLPLARGRGYDTESLAMAGPDAFVGIERVHEVRRFGFGRDGVRARGVRIALPAETRTLPSNAGLEALAMAPPGHPLAGALVAIAEQARGGDESPTRGWVISGRERFAFDVTRRDGFDVTDLAFLPSGEGLLLERRFRLLGGVACRIRRLPRDAFRPDVPVDGEAIFAADRAYEIDNMEGIALHRDPMTGATLVTLISDDNFSVIQRTILLEFALG